MSEQRRAVDLPGQAEHEAHIMRVLQRMPRRAYRIDPAMIPELVAWLSVVRKPYETLANQGYRGATPEDRARRKGEKEYGRKMCAAVDAIAHTLMEQRGVDEIEAALEEWRSVVASNASGA